MAGGAKNMPQRRIFLGGGGGGVRGSGVRDMALENLSAKFSETSFPHFTTYFTQIGQMLS